MSTKRLLRTVLVMFVVFSFSSTLLQTPLASAVTGADWKAGRIIDDGMFTNANDMSVGDIQNFLNAQVPSCDTNGTQPATEYGRSDLTHAQYAASRGWPAPPYACLRNFHEVPKTSPSPGIPDNSYNHGGGAFAGGVSAAQLIYDAAQKYQINPKVLLVKLRTESAGPLTSDTWPLQSQYTYAMGAQCPDSGPGGSANCNSNYAGFSIQIAESAALLRWYLDSMTQSWWQYKKPYQTNSILWNVSQTGCGASDVYIETKGTAALYTYTPYQPNAAALANLYGMGDGCSAYGNRNFWRVYSDWFGTTYNPAFSAQPVYQQVYTDSTKTTSLGWNATLLQGQSAYAVVVMKNNGNMTWTRSGAFGTTDTRLATYSPWGHQSPYCDNTWVINCTRPAALKEASVAPGEYGTFEFSIRAPNAVGTYMESFSPIVDGRTVFSSGAMGLGITVH